MFKNIYHTTYKLIFKIILILYPNKYNLTDQLFVDSKLRQYKSSLKNLLKWSYNPISILTFLNFLILNFILYWVYLFFLYYFVTYWLFWFTYYRFSGDITELKPSEYLYSWEISVSYSFIHICYLQTFYKGYLNSFNLIYLICYFCKKNNTYDYVSVTKFIPRFICTLSWVLFRVLTSLPRNVVMDSYKWSLDFTHSYKYWHYRRKNLTKNLKFIIIKCLIQDTLYGSLFPQSYLRVYKSSVELWNFN